MNKIILTIGVFAASVASLMAQISVSDKFSIYDLPNSKLHIYQTGDVMGDVSFIIEGAKELIILEQPLFWDNIKEFNSYVESLNKPIDRVVANYHSLGLADYPPKSVVMPAEMIAFNQSPKALGMVERFSSMFGDAADFRPYTKAKSFAVPSRQRWAGVEMQFISVDGGDFPAANILIDEEAYYRHFAPSMSHLSPMQLKSPEGVETMLAELRSIAESGAKYIVGSHGATATQSEVSFQIDYLERIKSLLAKCKDSDSFTQHLITAYQSLPGAEGLKSLAKSLYPNEERDVVKEEVRARVQDYFTMVSTLNEEVANALWAERDDISIITPRSLFVGQEAIMNDFLIKNFSTMQSRKLHSLCEVINVYGESANVQLYWIFDTVDQNGEAHQTRGRESLIFSKIDSEWRLVHVHYSRMPQ
ncbi:MAG: nuclear transport factor 2 family protein [Rikenellaceae bacterium]